MKKIKYNNLDIHTYLMFPVFVSHNVLIDSANIGLIKWSKNILEVFIFSQLWKILAVLNLFNFVELVFCHLIKNNRNMQTF